MKAEYTIKGNNNNIVCCPNNKFWASGYVIYYIYYTYNAYEVKDNKEKWFVKFVQTWNLPAS